jgi:hypothetical protein
VKITTPAKPGYRNVLFALCAVSLFGTAIGCTGSGSELEDPPRARVIYLNEISSLPSLEVFANAAGPTPVELGVLTTELELAPGTTQFVLTAPGSKEPILESTLELEDQLYLIAFTGKVAEGNLAVWSVDQAAPELESGQAAAEVANLYNGDLVFDVYFDDEPLVKGIGAREVSAFTVTTPATGTLQVFNAGDDVASSLPVATLATSLEDGRAVMVVMKNAATGNGIVLDTLTVR